MTVQVLTAHWVLPVDSPPIENGYVAFEGDRIVGIGHIEDPPKRGTILTPGLINCHTHLEQSYSTAIPKLTDEPFTTWLLKVVDRLKENEGIPPTLTLPRRGGGDFSSSLINRNSFKTTPKQNRCFLGVQEVLRAGTTCVNDIASGPESLQVLEQLGLRGIVSLEGFHPANEPVRITPWLERFDELAKIYFGHSRLKVGLSPHSPYNVSPNAWKALLETLPQSPIHSHIAESEAECQYLSGRPSPISDFHEQVLGQRFEPASMYKNKIYTPIAYLQAFGLLNNRTILAHAIYTNEQDRNILAENGVTVVHCPRSNLVLHGQTLDWDEWQSHQVPIGLGTDGRLSTPDLDIRAEARAAMTLHGWPPHQALEALTMEGARALRLEKEIGSLTVGKQADMVLWQIPGHLLDGKDLNTQNHPTNAFKPLLSIRNLHSPPTLTLPRKGGGDFNLPLNENALSWLMNEQTTAKQVWIAGQLRGVWTS